MGGRVKISEMILKRKVIWKYERNPLGLVRIFALVKLQYADDPYIGVVRERRTACT